MIINLIKYSLRSFKRQRTYVVINILGLSIGIACSLLIALFVINEASYDRYNKKKDRIYRLIVTGKFGGSELTSAATSAVTGPAMLSEFPEIEDFLRMMNTGWYKTVEYNHQNFPVAHIIEADSSFFNFFSIGVIKGDPRNLLNAPGKVVLSESTARKIFGTEDPVDKTLKIDKDTVLYTVTGIMADIPGNSHFDADIIVSFMSDPNANSPSWADNRLSTYLLLKPNSDCSTVTAKLPEMTIKYVWPEFQRFLKISFSDFIAQGNKYSFRLQKLTDIHLDASIMQKFREAGDPRLMKILSCIAILILLIAAINFTNLSTAQASGRAREVGIKKIGGSTRAMLIRQFLSESFILAVVSTVFGLILIKAMLPWFNNLLGSNLELNLFTRWYVIPVLILFATISGVLAGTYPAFFLSSFNPYEVLKGSIMNSMKNGRLRRVLVVFQFTVTIFLIVGTLIMYKQIRFMLNKDVGFDREQLLVINKAEALGNKVHAYKAAVKTIPGVTNIAGSTFVPGTLNNSMLYMLEGKKDDNLLLWTNWIDYDYLDTYGMTLVSGRSFNESYTTDNIACIVNETAVKSFSINDPEKTRFMEYADSGKLAYYPIIGVVKNFNFESLRNPVAPFIYRFQADNYQYGGYLTVKLSAVNYSKTIAEIEKKWKEFTDNEPFNYHFVDEFLEQMYIREKQNALVAITASVLAIFVAALGLFGLTSFTVEQRTKEIGVRKAMGSSVAGIYSLILKEVFILISISAIIACPLIYYFGGKWLENFYYRIEVGALTFIGGLSIIFCIALFTISYRVLRAAKINPAQSLKYE